MLKIELDKENVDKEVLEHPHVIYYNGWYWIAKETSKGVYQIDYDLSMNGFGELRDLISYYNERVKNNKPE